jgi:hypothetical protein
MSQSQELDLGYQALIGRPAAGGSWDKHGIMLGFSNVIKPY